MLPRPDWEGLEVMALKEYSTFNKVEYYWSHMIRLLKVISRTLFEGILPLCRDTVGVFYSPRWLDNSLGKSYSSAEMQSVYSTAPGYWATLWGSLPPLLRCSRCILQPHVIGQLFREVLSLCWDAVGVFDSPRLLGNSLGKSSPSAEMQSVYSTAPGDWATLWGSLIPLLRCSRCILQLKLIGLTK